MRNIVTTIVCILGLCFFCQLDKQNVEYILEDQFKIICKKERAFVPIKYMLCILPFPCEECVREGHLLMLLSFTNLPTPLCGGVNLHCI